MVGPSLDEAFQQAAKDSFGRSTFEGVVHRQILHPNRMAQVNAATGKALPLMPADLVTGEDAGDVAAYVAQAAAAQAGRGHRRAGHRRRGQQSDEPAVAENGVLDIPADPSGALAYTSPGRGPGRADRDQLG